MGRGTSDAADGASLCGAGNALVEAGGLSISTMFASLGDGWAAKADYNLERMRTHGLRRAAEMEEVAKTLTALGVQPLMTNGTVIRQREMAA